MVLGVGVLVVVSDVDGGATVVVVLLLLLEVLGVLAICDIVNVSF